MVRGPPVGWGPRGSRICVVLRGWPKTFAAFFSADAHLLTLCGGDKTPLFYT